MTNLMKVGIASGKGGTGKTTIATNLAYIAARNGQSVAYIDCDVEEPNGHIFLKPQITYSQAVTTLHPQVDESKCSLCGECARICRFSAIACVGQKVLVFPEMCHACGGCALVCAAGAIQEVPREIGSLDIGRAGMLACAQGVLKVGEAMSPPVIRVLKASAPRAELVIVDAPPGTSCPVIESIRDCNFVLLVTEPTPFGMNDLKLAVQMTRALNRAFAVVINRVGFDDLPLHRYCEIEGIKILAEISDDRRIAEAYSSGELACQVLPDYAEVFGNMLDALLEETTVAARS